VRERTTAIRLLLLVVGLGLVGFRPPAFIGTGPGASGYLTARTLDQAGQSAVPPIRASAAVVVDGRTGEVLWGKSPHQAFAPASMTKMMTALVALQIGQLDQTITSTVDASAMTGDSVMGLRPGERLTLRDLLFGLLVPSGDDAAVAIATALGGEESFVRQMNLEAARLGLTDTYFVNPHGLDAPGHVSSPYDMVAIARAAMAKSMFRTIVATQQITIRGRWTYDLHTTNYFLGRRPGIVGVKTGTTDQALHAITVADDRGDGMIYVTVMHTPDYVPDLTALLDDFEQKNQRVALDLPPSPLDQSTTGAGGQTLHVVGDYAPLVQNWRAQTIASDLSLTPDTPLRQTDNPDLPPANEGVATFYTSGEPIARMPLVRR
jgi:D-alanyl-D-alanine carboxypeptidase (penicillin-binding protein 5/6)